MKKFVIAALALAGLPAVALGQPDYDRNIEQAVMAIVAVKIGELRGGFAIGQKPAFVSVTAEESAMRPGEWRQGLALAADRPVVPTHGF